MSLGPAARSVGPCFRGDDSATLQVIPVKV